MKEKFISIFSDVLDCQEALDFSTQLDALAWDSVALLTFAAKLNEELQLTVSTQDFCSSKTIQDLFDAVSAKHDTV